MKNQLETIALFGTLTALLVSFGALIAPGYLYVFAALSLVMNLGAYFFSDRVVLRMHGATEVPPEQAPELHAMVEELAQKAQIPKPRVFVIAEDAPNAFATGRNPEHGVVAVTEGILRTLEYLADETGASISGDPEALARALSKLERGTAMIPPVQTTPATASLFIVNPFGAMERVSRLFSTHPNTAERVQRLLALAGSARRTTSIPVIPGLQRLS